MKHVFVKPYEFEGETFTEIEFNLDSISGWHIQKATRLYRKQGGVAAIPALEGEFAVLILHELTKKPLEFFNGLPAKDYIAVTIAVSNFLTSSD